jgi:transposase
MSPNCAPTTIATIGIDLGKNTFHLVGLDTRGAIVLQLKLSRGQIERRLANVPCCLIGKRLRRADHGWTCPLFGVKRSRRLLARNDAIDPFRTLINSRRLS